MEYNFADVVKAMRRMHSECADNCSGKCPLDLPNNGHNEFMDKYPEEYAKAVMDWAEAHRPKTNGEVARELLEEKFGINMSHTFSNCSLIRCDPKDNCADCSNNGFWDREYTGE